MSNFNGQHRQHSPPPIIQPAVQDDHALSQMRMEIANFTNYLHNEGFLDEEFTRLRELQDMRCPDFVAKVAAVFFRDCQHIVNDVAVALQLRVVDFNKVLAKVHQLKGSSSCFGAARIHELCVRLKPLCESQNRDGCIRCLHELYNEVALLHGKLQMLFWYEQHLINVGGTFPEVQ